MPVLDAAVAALKTHLSADNPVLASIRDVVPPESVDAGEPIRAADALLVVGVLKVRNPFLLRGPVVVPPAAPGRRSGCGTSRSPFPLRHTGRGSTCGAHVHDEDGTPASGAFFAPVRGLRGRRSVPTSAFAERLTGHSEWGQPCQGRRRAATALRLARTRRVRADMGRRTRDSRPSFSRAGPSIP